LLVSAATLAEVLIMSRRRGVADRMAGLLSDLGLEVVSVTSVTAQAAAAAYDHWGKGVHAASLNFADCFAYALAIERDCPLLFIGDDFARTDVRPAL
jgi:ribonuclease VapC